MRVTNGMISNRVVFNMQRSLRRFMHLETSMSSGRRINKPSDDPSGTLRDLNYRTELARIGQYEKNVGQALTWMNTYDSVLSDAKDFMSSAKEVALAMANDTYDGIAREASAREIQSILDQMIQLANSQLEGRSVFGGFQTRTQPLVTAAAGAVYQGDTGQMQFEIDSSQLMTVNLNGADVFLATLNRLGETSDVDVGVTGATLLADLHLGDGVDLSGAPASLVITDQNLNLSSSVDLSGATTVQDAIDTINAQLTADGITNLTVGLGETGNALTFTTTQTGEISVFTSLDRLNNGLGIDMDPGRIMVSDGAAVNVSVDLAGAGTVGDVITAFNSQLVAAGVNNVTLGINASGTGFEVIDSNGPLLDLTISDISTTDQTAAGLGIAGFVGAALIGSDLNPTVSFDVAETTGTTAADLGIFGSFTSDFVGADLDPGLQAASLLADFQAGTGAGLDSFVIRQGDASLSIDLDDPLIVTVQDLLDRINNSSLDVTASINSAGTGIQVVNDDPNRSLIIEEEGVGRAAKDLGLFGASDMIGALTVLKNALDNDDREAVEMMVGTVDDGIQHLLNHRGAIGSRAIRLETTSNRLSDEELNLTELLAEVEDADMTELITQLATYENNYQASLMASAKIIQPTLMDFLR